MKKLILIDITGINHHIDIDKMVAIWEETYDTEAVRKEFVAQTLQEPTNITVCLY